MNVKVNLCDLNIRKKFLTEILKPQTLMQKHNGFYKIKIKTFSLKIKWKSSQ